MGDSNKRKSGRDGPQNGRAFKKSKGGSDGRWKTPHQKAKYEHRLELGKEVEVGDAGIWVTFARGMTARAAKEIDLLCDEYGKKLFGVKHLEDEPKATVGVEDEDEEDEDISAAIEREVASMKQKEAPKPKMERIFQIVRTKVDCVFFVRTRPPVEPTQLVRAICEDALATGDHRQRKSRYLNRLTPITHTGKASESGIDNVAREALAPWFDLKSVREPSAEAAVEKDTESSEAVDDEVADGSKPAESGSEKPAYTFAIRQDIRQNRNLKSDVLIRQIAELVDKRHKVNLDEPDKIICVEVYQNLCAVGVVDGPDWTRMKKFNIAELYKQASEEAAAKKSETTENSSDVKAAT